MVYFLVIGNLCSCGKHGEKEKGGRLGGGESPKETSHEGTKKKGTWCVVRRRYVGRGGRKISKITDGGGKVLEEGAG